MTDKRRQRNDDDDNVQIQKYHNVKRKENKN